MSTKIVFEEDCNDKMLPFSFDLKSSSLKYVSTIEEIMDMRTFIENSSIVGIDTERKPSKYNRKGEGHIINPTAIVQIAVRNKNHDEIVYIIDLITISACKMTLQNLDEALSMLLSDDSCIKIGQGLERDFRELHSSYPDVKSFVKVNSVIETTSLMRHIDSTITSMVSLKYLVQRFLNCNLVKTQQMSNWEVRPLTLQQVHYAACDALVLLRLYDAMAFEAEELHLTTAEGDQAFDIRTLFSSIDCSITSLSKKRSRNNLSNNSLFSVDAPDHSAAQLMKQQWKGWSSPCAREWFSEQIRDTIESGKKKQKTSAIDERCIASGSPSSSSLVSENDGSMDELTLPLPTGQGSHLHFTATASSEEEDDTAVVRAAGRCKSVLLPVLVSDDSDLDLEDAKSVTSIKSIISRSSTKCKPKKKCY